VEPDQQEFRERKERLVRQVFKEGRVQLDNRDFRDFREMLVSMERLDLQVSLALKVIKVVKDSKVILGQLGTLDPRVRQVNKDQLVLLDSKDCRVFKGVKVFKVSRGRQELAGPQVILDLPELGRLGIPDPLDWEVPDLPGLPDLRVNKGCKVIKDFRVILERPDPQDLVPLDPLVLQDIQDLRVLEQLDRQGSKDYKVPQE
jgi:hypothetical protein